MVTEQAERSSLLLFLMLLLLHSVYFSFYSYKMGIVRPVL